LIRPELLQCEDDLLEFHANNSLIKKPRSYIEYAVFEKYQAKNKPLLKILL